MIIIWIILMIVIAILYNVFLQRWYIKKGIEYFLIYVLGILLGNSIIIGYSSVLIIKQLLT